MAKRARNLATGSEHHTFATQHKSSFHAGETGSSSQSNTSYKHFKYGDDTATLVAADATDSTGTDSNGTPPKIQSLSASALTMGRHLSNGYAPQHNQQSRVAHLMASSNQHPSSHFLDHTSHAYPVRQIQSATVMPTSGHYAANLVAGPTSKKSLLDLPAHPMSSSCMGHQASQTHPAPHGQHQSSLAATDSPTMSAVQRRADQISPSLRSLCSVNDLHGLRELLSSLALMCILSLLTSFLALFFLQRSCPISLFSEDSSLVRNASRRLASGQSAPPFNHRIAANAKEYMRVYQISVSLSTLTLCFDLCCLFVCCIQFLSIVKLMKNPLNRRRVYEFVKKTSHIRILAIGAYLVSIPIFFTGVILFTFVNFDEIPALITSIVIGVGIIFCGMAAVQNVYLWQWEKTKASEDMQHLSHQMSRPGTILLNNGKRLGGDTNYLSELSTLV